MRVCDSKSVSGKNRKTKKKSAVCFIVFLVQLLFLKSPLVLFFFLERDYE